MAAIGPLIDRVAVELPDAASTLSTARPAA